MNTPSSDTINCYYQLDLEHDVDSFWPKAYCNKYPISDCPTMCFTSQTDKRYQTFILSKMSLDFPGKM